jgi:hypothetical protein
MGAFDPPFFAIMKAKVGPAVALRTKKAPLPFASFRKFCEDSKSSFSSVAIRRRGTLELAVRGTMRPKICFGSKANLAPSFEAV